MILPSFNNEASNVLGFNPWDRWAKPTQTNSSLLELPWESNGNGFYFYYLNLISPKSLNRNLFFSGHLKAGPFFQKQPQILGPLDHDWVVKYVPIPGYPPPGLSKTTSPSQTPRRTWRKPCIKEDASPGRLWCYFLAELTRLEKDPKNHLKKKWKQAPHEVSLSQKMHNKGLIYPTIT